MPRRPRRGPRVAEQGIKRLTSRHLHRSIAATAKRQIVDSSPLTASPAAVAPRPVLRCFNVKYSPNLGDGLLSECLETALAGLGAEAGSIDLAARREYGDAMPGRDRVMKLLDAMPPGLRRLAVRAPLRLAATRKWGPHYAAGLAGADAVVLGGGNLLADLDLNFPTKLSLAVREAARRDLPIAIYGCGMAGGWSATGLKWCRAAFARPNLRAVFLRDRESVALWDELMAPQTGHRAQLVRDPGLLAAECFPAPPRAAGRGGAGERGRPVAGLGLMSHIAIRYHAEAAPAPELLDAWYLDLARGLLAEGFAVEVFTNGSPEDRAYAAHLAPRLRALGEGLRFLDQRDPAGLCRHIAGMDVLVAYRMHAVIAAYSYRVPAIGLAWDRKLRSFLASVGQEDRLLDVAATPPAAAVAAVRRAWQAGTDPAGHARVLDEARDGVARLVAALRPGAVAPAGSGPGGGAGAGPGTGAEDSAAAAGRRAAGGAGS